MTNARFRTDRVIEIPDDLVIGVTTTNAYINSTHLEFRTGGNSNGVLESTHLHLGNATSNAVLNSSALSFDGSPGGSSGDLVRLANGNFSGASQIDFDVSSYSYSGFRLLMQNYTISSSANQIRFRFSSDAGNSFISSAAYHYDFITYDVGIIGYASDASSYAVAGPWNGDASKSNDPAMFFLDIRSMANSSCYSYFSAYGYNEWGGDDQVSEWWGMYQNEEAHNAWRLYPSGGTITGQWVLYGLK